MATPSSPSAPATPSVTPVPEVGPFTRKRVYTVELAPVKFTTTEETTLSHKPTCGCQDAHPAAPDGTDALDDIFNIVVKYGQAILSQVAKFAGGVSTPPIVEMPPTDVPPAQ